MIRLFDSHCHLQDSRILNVVPKLIREALDTGVVHFAVNGVSEKDWHLVKEMSDTYPSVVPNFGLHPWFISERTVDWLETLKDFLAATPSAAVGEIGLDKGSFGKNIDFTDQVEVFRQQLQLAKELNKPASIHCVRAFGDLLEILKSVGPFPAVKASKAKKMLKSIPPERILLETDAPDARPNSVNPDSLFVVKTEVEVSKPKALTDDENKPSPDEGKATPMPDENINHPANIHHILAYVAHLLEMEEKELAGLSYENAVRLFSYKGSKLAQS